MTTPGCSLSCWGILGERMTRLTLDDGRWAELDNAYGSAGDVPMLLGELSQPVASWAWDEEPMYSLWSSLWHQGDVYSASYAAIPYLLDAVPINPPEGQRSILQLAACILASSVEENAPPVNEALVDFAAERSRMGELALNSLKSFTEGQDDLRLLLAVIAIAKED